MRFPLSDIGPNHPGLYESQKKILERFPADMHEYSGYKRCETWRPLTDNDLLSREGEPDTGLEYFNMIGDYGECYYWEQVDDCEP